MIDLPSPRPGPASYGRTRRLPAAVLLDDQNHRWRQGCRVRVEEYLERTPALRDDPEALLDLIYNEVRLREKGGETPQLEEYVARFPDLEELLAVQFEVHRAMRPGEALSDVSVDGGAGLVREAPAAVPAIAGYEVLEELGRGAMGVVYKARHLRLGRLVAIKMILAGPHAGARDLARFEAEARTVARLRHPNIVQIHEIGEQDARPYLCLELLEGGSLAQHLQGRALPPQAAARVVQTLARAVQYAHEQGIVHRDLKPANILLAVSSQQSAVSPERPLLTAESCPLTATPKITDFGLARLLDGDPNAGGGPSTAGPVGTPPYMAPEQAGGKVGGADRATDVYALGAILYEALTGRPPFLGATVYETLEQVRTLDPVPPRRLQPTVPRDLETICLACLRKEPGKRYAGAGALADDLARFTRGEPIHARPTPAWERVYKWCRRRPAHAALVAVGLVLAGGLLATALVGERVEANRVAKVREQADELVLLGQEAMERQDVDAARGKFQAAWVLVQAEPALQDLNTGVVGWLIHGERAALQRGWKQRVPPPEYDDRRDEALLLSLLLGQAPSAREAVQAALALTLTGEPAWGRERELLALTDADLLLLQAGAAPALRRLNQENEFPTRLSRDRRADLLERLSRQREAERERRLAAKSPPEGGRALLLAGAERLRRRDLDGAARQLERALDAEPEHFSARLLQAVCFLHQKRPAEATVALTACVAQRPGFAWSYLLRGQARLQAGDRAAAVEDFRRAAERLPETERQAFWRERVLTVPGLGQVRDLPEFRELGRSIDGKRPPTPGGTGAEGN
jgi:serine/threonine protein kinase/tetratricopeptide (TPR) repeat protein